MANNNNLAHVAKYSLLKVGWYCENCFKTLKPTGKEATRYDAPLSRFEDCAWREYEERGYEEGGVGEAGD